MSAGKAVVSVSSPYRPPLRASGAFVASAYVFRIPDIGVAIALHVATRKRFHCTASLSAGCYFHKRSLAARFGMGGVSAIMLTASSLALERAIPMYPCYPVRASPDAVPEALLQRSVRRPK